MLILHGTYVPQARKFALWAETDGKPASRRKPPKVAFHPFAARANDLIFWAGKVGVMTESEAQAQLWLPGTEQRPQPSPEMRAAGAFPDAETAPTGLNLWQVEALALTIPETVDLLLALAHRSDVGRDLLFWRAAAVEALALVAGRQVIPALARDGLHFRALWQPMPEQPERLAALAARMPPLSRAIADSPDNALTPDALLDSFFGAVVDEIIRESAPLAGLDGAVSPWLAALIGRESRLKLPTAQAEALFKTWQSWAEQSSAAGNAAYRVAFRLDAPEPDITAGEERPLWTLHYLLQATDDPSLIVSAGQIWRGQDDSYLQRRFDGPQERLLRGLAFAGRLFPPILDSLHQAAPESVALDSAQAYTFLKEIAALLQASGFRVLLPRWWGGKSARLTAKAKVSGSKTNARRHLSLETLVSYEWQAMLGGEPITRDEFERLAELKQPLVRLHGQWIVLDQAQVEAGLKFFRRASEKVTLEEALRVGLDDAPEADGVEVESVRADGWLRTLLDTLRQPDKIAALPTPDGLRAELRPYQQRGYAWLSFLLRYGIGACLADDMGLGKTLQTIALLLRRQHEAKVAVPSLVVCPTSVVGNWQREMARFAPELKTLKHLGAERSTGESFARTLDGVDVVLTSYPLLARDRESFETVEWSVVILDEAQNIKNSATRQAQAARALRTTNRIALTGTPVENRLTELWSILHFLNPGYLGSERDFRRRFANPIERLDDADAARKLKRLTAPFILRRLKTDPAVISDLPDKLEMKVFTPLTAEQGTLYEAVVRDIMARIEGAESDGDEMSRRGLVLSLLMQLKQVCNHPAQFLKDGGPFEGRSGKLTRLTEMLEEVYAEGDRALVFTQFAEMGEILRQHLRNAFTDEPLWLYGGTKVSEREELIRRFQAASGPTVFILSLKAGGVGLNLTRANHVFHFDRWWNPAVENQATDRAFRIGQTRNVQVHKFVCGGTLEEKIDAMIESKQALAERIVGADESWLTELSTASLRDLVQLRETDE